MSKLKLTLIVALMFAGLQAISQIGNVEMPVGKSFLIQSAINYGKNNGGCWDIPGHPKSINKGSNIQVWDLDGDHDRQYTILATNVKNYYEIRVGNTSNARVNVDGGKTADGTNVEVWDRDGKPKQLFRFQHLGNGRFKIFDRNNKVICLANRSSNNGSNVHIWGNHDGAWMEWYLIDANTKKAFIPQPISKNPDFFINNKFFKYKSGTMVGHSDGTAVVERIEGTKVFVKVQGTNYNSDVAPGEPTEKPFNYVMTINYENGNYIDESGGYTKGQVSSDGKKLSFSGDAYVELVVAKQPASLMGWIESRNDYSLEEYMQRVSLPDIKEDDANIIAVEVSKCDADGQSKVLMGILNGVLRNKNVAVRDYIYTELGKVEFKKANAIIRMSMNTYMNNSETKEPVQALKDKIVVIRKKISSAK